MLQEAIDDGELAESVDAALEANRLLALSDGVSVQALFNRTFWTDARQVDAIDVHLDDLRARGAVPQTPKRRARRVHTTPA